MANFFLAEITWADGRKEVVEGQLWFLGGIPAEGQKVLQDLRAKKESGEIVSLRISYES